MIEFAQFIMVGMVNAAVDLGSLNALLILFPTRIHALIVLYNAAAYLLTMFNSYLLNSRFTFRKHADRTFRQRLLYLIEVLICFLISNLVFYLGLISAEQLTNNDWLARNSAKLLSMALSSLASFLLMKYFVFRRKKAETN